MLWVFFCGLFAALVFHELGHWWFMARLGHRPEAFCLGLGPTLFAVSIFNTRFLFRLLLCGAGVIPGKSFYEEATWHKKLLVYAGGPLINLALGVTGICLTPFVIQLENGSLSLAGGFPAMGGFLSLIPETSAEVFSSMPGALLALGAEKTGPVFVELSTCPVTPSNVVLWFSMSNLLLGLANLFPFPPLDGARIVESLINRLTGRSMPVILHVIGYQILLLGFFAGVVAVTTGRPTTGWLIAGVVLVTLGTLAQTLNEKRRRTSGG